MTPTQIKLVKDSFAHVVPIQEVAAGLSYARLFEIDSSTAALFANSDMKRQGSKLMTALAMVVEGLDKPDTILPAAQALGRRHAGYRVTEAQYESVGEALLWTLQTGLGAAFTVPVAAAWAAAYAMLSDVMLAAAAAAPARSKAA